MPYLEGLQQSARLEFKWPISHPLEPEYHWPLLWQNLALKEPLEAKQRLRKKCTPTVYIPQATIQELERLYTFKERAKVTFFLERNPFLVPLLREAYDELDNYFPYSPLLLRVFTYPEETNDEQLIMLISTNLSPKEAFANLERFDKIWWLEAIERSDGKLCINVGFE